MHAARECVALMVGVQLINWPFLKNAVRVKTSTPIFALKQRLVERHGRMSELKLYKGPPMRANLVENEMLTLEDLGVDGKPDDTEVREVVTMYYDFTPYDHDGPLLLVEAERHLDDAEDGAEVK